MRADESFSNAKMTSRLRRWLGLITLTLSVVLHMPANAAGQGKAHVFGNPDFWQWAPNRMYHVENYKLTLKFDEPKGEVFGDEVVTLRPFEPHFRKFYLDSSELKIDSVTLEPPPGAPVRLAYKVQDPDSGLLSIATTAQRARCVCVSCTTALRAPDYSSLILIPTTRSGHERSGRRANRSSTIIGFRAGIIRTTWPQVRRLRRFPKGKVWFRMAGW